MAWSKKNAGFALFCKAGSSQRILWNPCCLPGKSSNNPWQTLKRWTCFFKKQARPTSKPCILLACCGQLQEQAKPKANCQWLPHINNPLGFLNRNHHLPTTTVFFSSCILTIKWPGPKKPQVLHFFVRVGAASAFSGIFAACLGRIQTIHGKL